MAIENERKYVLRLDFSEAALSGWAQEKIEQSYLEPGVRIREINGEPIFTYKKFVPGNGLVEIETPITANDYLTLRKVSSEFIRKTRYKRVIDGEEWVVDFLKDENNQTYFVMAEVEMEPGQDLPNTFPIELLETIVHTVEREDLRFTNRHLSDPRGARRLYEELILIA